MIVPTENKRFPKECPMQTSKIIPRLIQINLQSSLNAT